MKKLLSLCLVLVLMLSLLVGCSSSASSAETTSGDASNSDVSSESTGEPQFGGTLTVGIASAPVSLNVWNNNDNVAAQIMDLVIPHPVQGDADGNKVLYLADSIESNEDATQYTLKIKEDLNWSDGTPVTSEDFKFTVEYCLEHSLSYAPSMYGTVESMECPDDKTIIYNLSVGDINFFTSAGYWVPIMPKSVFESVDDPMNYEYDGSLGYGPYVVSEQVSGEYVVLTKNPEFTMANDGKGAYLDQIVFRVFSDENAMVLALKNGEIDCTGSFISVASQNQFAGDANFELMAVQSLGYGFISYSQRNELLQDFAVRKAFAMAMDRDAICAVGYQGGAVPMNTPISPVWKDFTASNIQQPAFDIEGAKAVLTEGGYKDTDGDGIMEKDGKKLSFTMTYKNSLANVDAIMEIVRSNAEKAGIEVVLTPVDASTYSANVTVGHDYDLSYATWGAVDNIDTNLFIIYGMNENLNHGEYKNQDMEDLLLECKSTVDYDKRVELLNEWQQLFVETLPTVNLTVATNTYAVNSNKFADWSLVPGNYGPLGVNNVVYTYVK